MPSLFRCCRKMVGRGLTDFPVPMSKISGENKKGTEWSIRVLWADRGDAPGLGTTTSKTSNLLSSHPFHAIGGMSHRRTSPSRKMHALWWIYSDYVCMFA